MLIAPIQLSACCFLVQIQRQQEFPRPKSLLRWVWWSTLQVCSPSVLSLLVCDSLGFPCSSRCVNLRFIITVIFSSSKTSYYHYNHMLYCTVKSTSCLQLTASHSEPLPRRLRPAFSSSSLSPSCYIRYGSFGEFFSRKAAGCKHVETDSLQYLTTNSLFCMAGISKLLFALE